MKKLQSESHLASTVQVPTKLGWNVKVKLLSPFVAASRFVEVPFGLVSVTVIVALLNPGVN